MKVQKQFSLPQIWRMCQQKFLKLEKFRLSALNTLKHDFSENYICESYNKNISELSQPIEIDQPLIFLKQILPIEVWA